MTTNTQLAPEWMAYGCPSENTPRAPLNDSPARVIYRDQIARAGRRLTFAEKKGCPDQQHSLSSGLRCFEDLRHSRLCSLPNQPWAEKGGTVSSVLARC
jgi:hypothetical protein